MELMNLRNWTAAHTKGLILGVISPVVFITIVIFLRCWIQNFQFQQMWHMFTIDSVVRSKIISIAIISNLAWFYGFLNREKYGLAMGVILGTICFLPYIIYVNFIR
jgi:hypothetical protein